MKPTKCQGCPLYDTGLGPVDPQMPRKVDPDTQTEVVCAPRLVVVSDSPEQQDLDEATPLQGQAGKMLRVWLREAGVRSSHCYATHLVKCLPPGEKLTKEAVNACAERWLVDELQRYPNVTWILAGKAATEWMLKEDLDASAGYVFKHPIGSGLVIPIRWAGDAIKNPRDTGLTKRQLLKAVTNAFIEPDPPFTLNPKFSDLAEFVRRAGTGTYMVFDTETISLTDLRMLCIGITNQWGDTVSVAWSPQVKSIVEPLFASDITKIAYNIIFDYKVLLANGVEVGGTLCDLMRLVQLDDVGTAGLSLENVASAYLHVPSWKRKAESEGLLKYNAKDTYYEWRIYREVEGNLAGTRRWSLWQRTKNLERVVAAMELRGFHIDVTLLQSTRTIVEAEWAKEQADWDAMHPGVNVRSPKQVKELFEAIGIEPWKNREGKISTEERFIKLMKGRQPKYAATLDKLLQVRFLAKLATTYLRDEMYPASDGALHPHIRTTGTVSGRFSFNHPNLGNIPKGKDKFGVRNFFVSRPGCQLVSADWSQAETRVTAILANERTMLDAWARGEDVHRVVASSLFSTSYNAVTKDQRELAKRIVYGLSYGSGAIKVSELADISFIQAKRHIQIFKKVFAAYFTRLSTWADEAISQGFLSNPFGRVHNFSGDRVFTQARNFIPQSTVADMMNTVLCRIWERIQGKPIHILLQIYDQIILEATDSHVSEAVNILQQEMNVGWAELNGNAIPADVSVGVRWGDL